MGIQSDIKDALDGDREDLIRVLADHRLYPAVVEHADASDSGLLGKKASPTFRLDATDGESNVLDRQTTLQVVDALGLESEPDCETVREEIEEHPSW